jgi:uncharacterized protein YlxW (UPF0749 family)
MSQRPLQRPKNIPPLTESTKTHGPADVSGEAVLSLLQKAARAAQSGEEQARASAQKISEQLKSAEDRVAQLEAEIQHYAERAARAEEWLLRVYTEIEDKFFEKPASKPSQAAKR